MIYIDASSEQNAEEIVIMSRAVSSGGYNGTAYVRVVGWQADGKLYFKWQRRQDGFNYLKWLDARQFSVTFNGQSVSRMLTLGTAGRNWEDFSAIESFNAATGASGTFSASGVLYWNQSASASNEITVGGAEPTPTPEPEPEPDPPEPYVDDETVEYSAYLNGNLLYYPGFDEYAILDPVIDMEINRAGSFSFAFPEINTNYPLGEIALRKANIEVRQGNYILFRGRPLTEDGGMEQRSKYYCEGCLAYLNDSLIDPGEYKGTARELFKYYLSEHNRQCDLFGETNRKILYSYSDMTAVVTVKYEKFVKTMQAVLDLINFAGGYLFPVYDTDSTGYAYVSSFSTQSYQDIDFGENLLEYVYKRDASQIVNVVRAVGGENNQYQYHAEDTDSINRYGRSAKVIYPGNIKSMEDARIAAKSELALNLREKRSIRIGAIDLHLLYPAEVRRLRVGTVVKVNAEPVGLASNFLCTRARIDLADPRKTVYYFGEETSKIAGMV